MTGTELKALRSLLFFSVSEAARWVAASPERPAGVEDRTWNRWESGKVPVPENIGSSMLELAAWSEDMYWRGCAAHKQNEKAVLVWYDTPKDYPGEAAKWRPYCSVIARLYADNPASAVIVPFSNKPENHDAKP